MSAEDIQRAYAPLLARLDDGSAVNDPAAFLREVAATGARSLADAIFFKMQTETGWTEEAANGAADALLYKQILAITDVVHANGGTIEMAEDMGRAAAIAYGDRLRDLTLGFGAGGVA